jgi:two-component system, NtrC family, response regulator AtoC
MQNAKRIDRVLIAEDEPDIRDYLAISLRCRGYEVEQAENGNEVLSFLKQKDNGVSLVLLDIMMPWKDGIETLREIRQLDKNIPVVMLSGISAATTIIQTMKCGADDYLTKPVTDEQLFGMIEATLATREAAHNLSKKIIGQIPQKRSNNGNSWMKTMEKILSQVGLSEAPVLLQGETGAGKEVLARMLHAASPRASRPFLKVNCAALPSELVESELFGYEKGAFTGAFKSKLGKFDMADGGTIFLDEIGDMDYRLQAKLLQVLQDQEFHRLGGSETIRVDVRVMAATHSDLEKGMREGRFREDLYYRLNVINLHVPPLRDRPDEILPLAEYFLRKHAVPGAAALEITPSLSDAMLSYHWPGNIRELENVARKYLALQDPEAVAQDLRLKTQRGPHPIAPDSQRLQPHAVLIAAETPTLENVTEARRQAEIDAILTALNRTRWNRKQAAAVLRVDYKALLYKMKKLGIDRKPAEGGTSPALPLQA